MIFQKQFAAALILVLISFSEAILAYTPAGCTVDDPKIVNDILAKFLSNKAVSTSHINVTSQDCVVTLSGNLKTDAEASAVVEMAVLTPGVLDVNTTQLMVTDSTHFISDAYITSQIKGKFNKEKVFGDKPLSATDIRVETKNGVVYLTGTADANQAKNAENFARAVEGVTGVELKFNIVPTGHMK
ncbi:MAG TPA: BON domain-containing protein [Gammaproteobacteria bacterium]|nr:BON domain-containing protein [Gammaproteobacteria bacterium]